MNVSEFYEIELEVYQAELKNYLIAVKLMPHLAHWFMPPTPPTPPYLISGKHWDMSSVTTHSRRKWK